MRSLVTYCVAAAAAVAEGVVRCGEEVEEEAWGKKRNKRRS